MPMSIEEFIWLVLLECIIDLGVLQYLIFSFEYARLRQCSIMNITLTTLRCYVSRRHLRLICLENATAESRYRLI